MNAKGCRVLSKCASQSISCPALLISAPSSGQGKTTVTAALARFHRNQGRNVHVFKTGPDFLDPMILAQASGNPVYQLDLWMGGENHCRELLFNAAKEADIILIEGVMGLFDGNSSSANLAKLFGIPVLAVINASAMAQTFAAIAFGLAKFDKALDFAGVLANRVASENHKNMIAESLPDDIPFYGAIFRDEEFSFPSRYLGLYQAQEIQDLEKKLERSAAALSSATWNLMPDPVVFVEAKKTQCLPFLEGQRIAVAKDQVFSFIYQANIDLLESMGAELVYFSPLNDAMLPSVNSLYLPGGYPELYLDELSENMAMKESIRQHAKANKPIVAECGGMLYLLDSLADQDGHKSQLLGIIPGNAEMQKRRVNLGMHSVNFPEGEIRGHTYHHSIMTTLLHPYCVSKPQRKSGKPEVVLKNHSTHASYMHFYFPSNPLVGANLFVPQTV